MNDLAALRLAIDLVKIPSRIRAARDEPLPEGVTLLLRIAAGDEEAAAIAAEPTGRSAGMLREAATFFIEQILLAPGTDSYRVLGASPDADPADLRRNMALLLRWLHPDVAGGDQRAMLAARVTSAWEDLKTSEKRAAYDRGRAPGGAISERARKRRSYRPGYSSMSAAKRSSWRASSFLAHRLLRRLLGQR